MISDSVTTAAVGSATTWLVQLPEGSHAGPRFLESSSTIPDHSQLSRRTTLVPTADPVESPRSGQACRLACHHSTYFVAMNSLSCTSFGKASRHDRSSTHPARLSVCYTRRAEQSHVALVVDKSAGISSSRSKFEGIHVLLGALVRVCISRLVQTSNSIRFSRARALYLNQPSNCCDVVIDEHSRGQIRL